MTRKRPYFVPSLPPMPAAASAQSDRDAFDASLALFAGPDTKDRVIDADADIDAFIECAFSNMSMPPT